MAHAKKIKGFEAHCMKAPSNNIFICPKKKGRGKNKSRADQVIEWLNKKMSTHACCKSKKKKRNSKR